MTDTVSKPKVTSFTEVNALEAKMLKDEAHLIENNKNFENAFLAGYWKSKLASVLYQFDLSIDLNGNVTKID